jgi:hypothetical protein
MTLTSINSRYYGSKPCNCGSGHERYELTDAAGIFCTYVCEDCEEEKRSHYSPAIFDTAAPYAVTGEEEDIGRDWLWGRDY